MAVDICLHLVALGNLGPEVRGVDEAALVVTGVAADLRVVVADEHDLLGRDFVDLGEDPRNLLRTELAGRAGRLVQGVE